MNKPRLHMSIHQKQVFFSWLEAHRPDLATWTGGREGLAGKLAKETGIRMSNKVVAYYLRACSIKVPRARGYVKRPRLTPVPSPHPQCGMARLELLERTVASLLDAFLALATALGENTHGWMTERAITLRKAKNHQQEAH